MRLYIVYADTYNAPYGSEMSIFGIFSDKEKAEQRKKSLDENYEYDVWIEETTLDENCEINLGGYIE